MNKTLSAVLTYHRLTPDQENDLLFHDVPISMFRRQMERVAALGATDGAIRTIVTFDDGTTDHMHAAEILTDLNLTGLFFVISDRLDISGYLARADVRSLVALGHQIGSHTVTHRRLPTLSNHELNVELKSSRDILEQLTGRRIDWLAPPGGGIDERTLNAAFSCGYGIVRTMRWGYAPGTLEGLIPTIPIFRWTRKRHFERVLAGNASFFSFRLKEATKRIVGLENYVTVRNKLAGWIRVS
jgi:peptidoglycan/xylan/chitin deacetylase (PgdA/CDA1 family)